MLSSRAPSTVRKVQCNGWSQICATPVHPLDSTSLWCVRPAGHARPSIPETLRIGMTLTRLLVCTEPMTERRPSKQVQPLDRKRRSEHTPAQKAKLLVAYAQLPTDSGGWKRGVGSLCKEAGHGAKKTQVLLAEAGQKRKRGEPLIEVVRQPAQSPDFNLCHLAFFRALSVAVRKRRRTTMRGVKRFDIDQLVEDVHQAYKEYPPEQIEAMWRHKSYVMGAVLETKPKKGGSNYPRHDPTKKLF